MKIIYATGQTCNQFWTYINYIVDCLENEKKIIIWKPDIVTKYFPGLLNSSFITFPLYSKILSTFIGYDRYIKLLNIIFFNKYSIFVTKYVLNIIPNIDFSQAKISCSKVLWLKHSEAIKEIFTPDKTITDEINGIFSEIKKNNTLVVGVHIRYGDYATFMNGKYCYTLDQYQSVMERMLLLLPKNNVLFFIASNENICTTQFKNANTFKIKNSFSVKDLYGLSKCDYIIGPPSTFSAWASLFENINLYHIEDIKIDFNLDNFIKIEDLWFT